MRTTTLGVARGALCARYRGWTKVLSHAEMGPQTGLPTPVHACGTPKTHLQQLVWGSQPCESTRQPAPDCRTLHLSEHFTQARRPARTDRPGIDSQASLFLRHALLAGSPSTRCRAGALQSPRKPATPGALGGRAPHDASLGSHSIGTLRRFVHPLCMGARKRHTPEADVS